MPESCPKCGKAIEPGDVKCPACGAELPAPVIARPNPAVVIFAALVPIIGLIVVLGFIAAIAVVLLRRHQAPTPATAPVSLQQTQSPMVTSPALVSVPTTEPPQIPMAIPASPAAAIPPPPPPPVTAPVMPAVPPPVAAPAVDYPAPTLTDFDPPISAPGSTLKLNGENLGIVNRVLMISSHGEGSKKATIVSRADKQLWISVPDVPFADYGIIIAAFSPGGVAILADQHTLSAESYSPDSHPHHGVVSVHSDNEIFAGDHMVILARPGAEVSLGDDCIAFLSENVRLKAVGKRCKVYFVPPAPLEPGVSRDGLVEIKALSLNFDNDAFRVKPAPPGQEQ